MSLQASLFVFLLIISAGFSSSEKIANDLKSQMEEGRKNRISKSDSSSSKMKNQRVAIMKWGESLTEQDYNATYWALTMRKQPQNFFSHYTNEISNVFKTYDARLNFVLVGACDGTHDNTISERFLPNPHWYGLFVEPVTMNYADLIKFLEKNNVKDRSHTIQAAVTNQCNSTNITIKFANTEFKNPNAPHWLRREIGGIVGDQKLGNQWKTEQVRCLNPTQILTEWTIATTSRKAGKKKKNTGLIRRPHVLKIDAEGHDYQVLMGFVDMNIPDNVLPLLISFEAKSMFGKLPHAKEILAKRGYVVSEGDTNDGFALLKSSAISKPKRKPKQEST